MAIAELIDFWSEPEPNDLGTRVYVVALVEDAIQRNYLWNDPPEFYNAYCETDFLIDSEEDVPQTKEEVLKYIDESGMDMFEWTPVCYE